MACYSPFSAYRAAVPNESGRRPIVFSRRESGSDEVVKLPCGQCVGCRLERARQWSIRCMHEASLYERNCFLTLTYRDEDLPEGGTLVRRDLQLFLKRMRKHVVKSQGRSFRFYGCGEYGDRLLRPHYHLLIFDFDFSDKRKWRRTASGHDLFVSEVLKGLWPLGNSEIGSVSFDSAGYVARYCLKKIVGRAAADHYARVDADGRCCQVLPEFGCNSLKPGVGAPWLSRFSRDVYPDDFVVVNGRKMRPPKFYDRSLERDDPGVFDLLVESREPQSTDDVVRLQAESSRSRLSVREEVAASRLATFSKRSL